MIYEVNINFNSLKLVLFCIYNKSWNYNNINIKTTSLICFVNTRLCFVWISLISIIKLCKSRNNIYSLSLYFLFRFLKFNSKSKVLISIFTERKILMFFISYLFLMSAIYFIINGHIKTRKGNYAQNPYAFNILVLLFMNNFPGLT